ncbi:unnamed protein product [Rotaria magnacalcarata]|nr:unnamed protein product [Rotaria magnacalcarata]
MVRDTGRITLLRSMDRPRTVKTAANIQKVKQRHDRLRIFSCRKIARDLRISRTSTQRILKDDLKLKSYKKKTQPKTSEAQKAKRLKFANWIRTNFRKQDTLRFLFSDEKMFDIDGVYNSQNERIWVPSRADADVKGGIMQVQKFPKKVMVRLGACSKGVSPLVIFENETVDHERYIQEVLPVALKFGNNMFGDNWTFQQDGGRPHIHRKTQDWCRTHLPCFIDKDHWPPNSPDLNPLDYCIWDEFVGASNWNLVTSKTTLINELKRSVKKIRPEVVFESCASWTNRLYRLKQANGNCLNK